MRMLKKMVMACTLVGLGAVGSAGCGSKSKKYEPPQMTNQGLSASCARGGTVATRLRLERPERGDQLRVDIEGMPAGIKAVFVADPFDPSGGTMTFACDGRAAPGKYTLPLLPYEVTSQEAAPPEDFELTVK